ncbi:MAG: SGNH/GDSL hydrolase family protein [Gemmatimonadaceae bacterium]
MISGRKKVAFIAILVLLLLAIAEGASRVALAVVAPAMGIDVRSTRAIYAEQTARVRALLDENSPPRETIDSALGWRYRPGYRNGADAVTMQGLRADRVYDSMPPNGVLRVAAFGDSFVYGNEVGNADSWTALIEQDAPRIEALNFGVGGYGVDQAYLRYLVDGESFSPHVVVMGFISDDLRRLVNVYRRFVDSREVALSKPRFVLDTNQGLRLVSNPMPTRADYERLLTHPSEVKRLGAHDHWYDGVVYDNPVYDLSATVRLAIAVWERVWNRYLDPNRIYAGDTLNDRSEAFRIQLALFERFLAAAGDRRATPLILLFPDRFSLERMRAGGEPVYAPMTRELAALGAPVIDLADAFAAISDEAVESWFMPGGHYSRRGNEIVAQYVRARLESLRTRAIGVATR